MIAYTILLSVIITVVQYPFCMQPYMFCVYMLVAQKKETRGLSDMHSQQQFVAVSPAAFIHKFTQNIIWRFYRSSIQYSLWINSRSFLYSSANLKEAWVCLWDCFQHKVFFNHYSTINIELVFIYYFRLWVSVQRSYRQPNSGTAKASWTLCVELKCK